MESGITTSADEFILGLRYGALLAAGSMAVSAITPISSVFAGSFLYRQVRSVKRIVDGEIKFCTGGEAVEDNRIEKLF